MPASINHHDDDGWEPHGHLLVESEPAQDKHSGPVTECSSVSEVCSDNTPPGEQKMAENEVETMSLPTYSFHELVAALGHETDVTELPPELERRVRDFHLAQRKRREKYGEQLRHGIFGMYAHLATVRIDLEWAEDAAYRRSRNEPYLSWSDFDNARKKGVNRPWFTYCVIFVCSVMLLVEFGLNNWKVAPLKQNPMIGPSAQALINAGARDTTLIIEKGQWFRIFSPIILHAGIIHYVINMAALFFVGAAVEQTHGPYHAFALFLIPGVGGNILSAIFLPQYISVGASGGIFGLIGGCLADLGMNWTILFIKDSPNDTETSKRNAWAMFWLILDIVVNIVLGLTPYIDNFTHLGGMVYGTLCGLSTIEPLKVGFFGVESKPMDKIRKLSVRFFGVIMSVFLIVITTVLLSTMNVGDIPCSGCRYISCVPFPWWLDNKWWYCDDCNTVVANLYKDDSSQYYDQIVLTCPNNVLETINVTTDHISDSVVMRKALPSYCRDYCDSVFKK